MEKEKILDMAISIIRSVNASETESIQINTTNYDDGSKSVSIEISYPSDKKD